MTNVPLNARVEAADGPCGEMVTMIFNPITWQLTHYVIQDKDLEQRSVPIEMVEQATADVIHLRCTRAELAKVEPFVETHYIQSEVPMDSGSLIAPYAGYGMYYGAYSMPMEAVDLPVQEERVPPGELTAHRGMPVEASDGAVGKVDQFLLDPKSGMITHLVLEEKHHLHKQQVTVPVAAIDQVLEDTVFLKLDKHAVSLLPAIPIKRHLWPHPADKRTEMLAIVFEDTQGASQALDFVKKLHHGRLLKIIEAAVLVKEQDGTTSVKETMSAAPRHGREVGAVAGGLAGLLVGPVGLVVGALVGAGAGGAVASKTERDFSHEFLENLERLLQPGRSGLVLLVEHEDRQQLSDELGELKGVVSYQKLSDLVAAQAMGEEQHAAQPTNDEEQPAEHN
jgi:uncharacterized membrane protein